MKYDILTSVKIEKMLEDFDKKSNTHKSVGLETLATGDEFLSRRENLPRTAFAEGVKVEANLLTTTIGEIGCLKAEIKDFREELKKVDTFLDFHPYYSVPDLPTKSDIARAYTRSRKLLNSLCDLKKSLISCRHRLEEI